MELKDKFDSLIELLRKAISDFDTVLNADLNKYNALEIDWIKNAGIQKFEFCIELSWKTAKIYLESVEDKLYTPKLTLKSFYLMQLIEEDLYIKLMNALNDRNKLSHVYNAELFSIIHRELPTHLVSIKKFNETLCRLEFL